MPACKRFTHFVDHEDGTGYYRDYNDMGRVLARHRAAVKASKTVHSWIEEYDPETGEGMRRLADWFPPSQTLIQKQ